jgi:hypothetical protein
VTDVGQAAGRRLLGGDADHRGGCVHTEQTYAGVAVEQGEARLAGTAGDVQDRRTRRQVGHPLGDPLGDRCDDRQDLVEVRGQPVEVEIVFHDAEAFRDGSCTTGRAYSATD